MEILWAGIAMVWVLWAGIGIGMIGKAWLESLSRNPEMEKKYLPAAILSIAFAEATAIFALVVAIMIL